MKFRNLEMIFRKLIILQEKLPIHIPNRFRSITIQEAESSRQVCILYLQMYRWADRQERRRMEDMHTHLLQTAFRHLRARM